MLAPVESYCHRNSPARTWCTRCTRQTSLVCCAVCALCLSGNGHTYNLDAPEPSNPSGRTNTLLYAPSFNDLPQLPLWNCGHQYSVVTLEMLWIRWWQHSVSPDHSEALGLNPLSCLQLRLQVVYACLSRVSLLSPACCSSNRHLRSIILSFVHRLPFNSKRAQAQTARPTATCELGPRMTKGMHASNSCAKRFSYGVTNPTTAVVEQERARKKQTKPFGKNSA